METMPTKGTKVRVIKGTPSYESFNKTFGKFDENNEWEVCGEGSKTKTGEYLVSVRNLHKIWPNQSLHFFKKELEEI